MLKFLSLRWLPRVAYLRLRTLGTIDEKNIFSSGKVKPLDTGHFPRFTVSNSTFYSRLIHLHLNTCSNRYILPLIFAARWLHSRLFTSPREYREKNPPSVKFPFYLHSESKMDQKLANKLFEDGAFLFILDLPVGTEFGIDLNIWNTGEKFKGVKLIPPGFHFVFYR